MKTLLRFLALPLVLAACSGEPEPPKAAAIRVEGEVAVLAEPDKANFLKLAPVETDAGGWLRLPGRLVWNETRTVRVYPQVAGRIQSIAVDLGQPVKSGQPLALLQAAEYGQALADAHKAKAEASVAAQALERNRQLREAGIVAEKDWQQSEAAAIAARAEAARATQRLAGLGGAADQPAAGEKGEKVDKGEGAYALRSPLAGIVVERNINPGMEFRPDQSTPPLFVVTDPASLWLQLDAGEADLGRLKPGGALQVETRQYPGETFPGVIRHVADFVDPATRTIKVRAEVANADRRLKGEMFVTARIALPPSQALRVPATAVFLAGQQRYVFVEEASGRYRRQPVQAGAERDGAIDLFDGVKAGERVVVEGSLHLLKYFKPGSGKAGQATP